MHQLPLGDVLTLGFHLGRSGVVMGLLGLDIVKEQTKAGEIEHVRNLLHVCRLQCASLDLPVSMVLIDRMLGSLEKPGWKAEQIEREVLALADRMRDECQTKRFLFISSTRVPYYEEPTNGWGAVPQKFKSAAFDVEECGKTFACARYTASVFHVMRILEVGLHALGLSLDDADLLASTNRTWDMILKKCRKELDQKTVTSVPAWQADPSFFGGATAYLQNVKDAWRNPTMHVEEKYVEEEALRILTSAQLFMGHLATQLRETV